MNDIGSFNKILQSAESADDLIKIYQTYAPDMVKNNPIKDIFYCSGVTALLVGYFVDKKARKEVLLKYSNATDELNSKNVDAVWKQLFQKINEPYIAFIQSMAGQTHEAGIIGIPEKKQWAFYQANIAEKQPNWVCLLPALNKNKKNCCINKMDEKGFKDFLTTITDKSNNDKIFSYEKRSNAWWLTVVTLTGKFLLPKDD